MPSITFDKFDRGLDLSKSASVSDANQLRELKNAFITKGKVIRKRPGLPKIATLEAGTKGLVSGGGYLNTFYESGSITHGDGTFRANRVAHPVTAQDVKKIHYGDIFNGYIYTAVEYVDGSVYQHYLDEDADWVANTAYSLDDYASPAANDETGLRYKCTTAGTSHASVEPTWTDSADVGDTINDGTVVWTAESTYVQDSNCSHEKACIKQASKMWSVDGEVVRFCATNAPRDWTTSSDAGYLPTGLQSNGSTDALALGQYDGRMAVFFVDSLQVWDVDPDPTLHAFYKRVNGIGTRYLQSIQEFSGDIFFGAKQGIRSVTQQAYSNNLNEVDVGSPIDSRIKPLFTDTLEPISTYFSGAGQYWLVMPDGAGGSLVYPYSFSKTKKIAAWAEYAYDMEFSDVASHNGYLYLRSGDDVYRVDESDSIFADDGIAYEMRAEMPFLDFKLPGHLKQIRSMDIVVQGTVDVQFRFDPNDTTQISTAITLTGDTRTTQTIPIEACLTSIAPVFVSNSSDLVQIDSITFYFDDLGPV